MIICIRPTYFLLSESSFCTAMDPHKSFLILTTQPALPAAFRMYPSFFMRIFSCRFQFAIGVSSLDTIVQEILQFLKSYNEGREPSSWM